NLKTVLNEMRKQPLVGSYYPEGSLSYEDDMAQISEYIEVAGEYGIAFDTIISNLKIFPFVLSGSAAAKLVEVAVIFECECSAQESK
ncbi:hypothetical protein QE250_06995, partial [Chromatiaceae bacterium AAb-1]|nr:hypothetical protein [Chromatiaceae bacterium AAb-1]